MNLRKQFRGPGSTRSVVSIGGAGGPNFGDELIVKGWLEYFNTSSEGPFEVLFFENIAKNTRQLVSPWLGERNRFEFSDFLARVAQSVEGLDFWQQAVRGYGFIDRDGPSAHPSPLWDRIAAAEVVHLHGGGYLNDMGPHKGFLLGLCAALKRRYGMRVAATGIGFGPVKPLPEDPLLAEIFGCFDVFEVRDPRSFEYLQSHFPFAPLYFGHDDCYLLRADQLVSLDAAGGRRLHLSFLEYNVRKFDPAFWERVRELASQCERVLFWESYPWQDRRVVEHVRELVPRMEVLPIAEAMSGGVAVSPDDIAVAARFHVHYVLARAGVRGWYLRDSPYYDAKHRSIVLRGSPMKEGSKGLEGLPAAGSAAIRRSERLAWTQKRALADLIFFGSEANG